MNLVSNLLIPDTYFHRFVRNVSGDRLRSRVVHEEGIDKKQSRQHSAKMVTIRERGCRFWRYTAKSKQGTAAKQCFVKVTCFIYLFLIQKYKNMLL